MIGVFDSGFGGLTIHRALTAALPQQDFVYLGDNRNAPYGLREPIDVLTLTCVGVQRLFDEGCNLVVIACNTASTVALRWIQQQWLPAQSRGDGISRNVLGIVVPTIEAATGQLWHDETPQQLADDAALSTIAVFATERTVATETYPFEIHKRRPDIRVHQQACPALVPLIESGAPRDELRAHIHRYVGELHARMGQQWPDRVILGCTHYPLVADMFAEVLPAGIQIIDQPAANAAALKEYLVRHPQYANGGGGGKRVFLSTGYAPEALPAIESFWGSKLDFQLA